MIDDAALRRKVRSATGFLRELIDLADEQGWSYRVKDEGFLFFPPRAKARPGMTQVFASDPGNQSHTQRQIRERFHKAGLVFPDERKEKSSMTDPQNKVTKFQGVRTAGEIMSAHPEAIALSSAFQRLRQKINSAVSLLSDIEQIAGEIERDNLELQPLREVIKNLDDEQRLKLINALRKF